jgi:hypothetical protein
MIPAPVTLSANYLTTSLQAEFAQRDAVLFCVGPTCRLGLVE